MIYDVVPYFRRKFQKKKSNAVSIKIKCKNSVSSKKFVKLTKIVVLELQHQQHPVFKKCVANVRNDDVQTPAKVPIIEIPILDEEEQQYEGADTVDYDCLPLPSTSTTDY